MKVLTVFILIFLLVVPSAFAAASPSQKMRPYAGIGILQVPISGTDSIEALPLYEEPALSRQGELNKSKIPPFEWIFGPPSVTQPMIVMARKGTWLRVVYDDAGREGWLNPPRDYFFQGWELFFKRQVSRLLPGLQKKYYQVFQQPGLSPATTLTTGQPFKVLHLENDWALVLIDQISLGWLRWRDEDGRLLIGSVTNSGERRP